MTAVALAAVLGAGSSTAFAVQDTPFQAAIDFRTANMTLFSWYLKPMALMVKGKMPYDQAAFSKNASSLAKAAEFDLLAGFPKGSTDIDSDAKQEIWEKWSEFSEKHQDLQRESARLAEISVSGELAAIKAQFKKTAGTCKGCHKPFREKN